MGNLFNRLRRNQQQQQNNLYHPINKIISNQNNIQNNSISYSIATSTNRQNSIIKNNKFDKLQKQMQLQEYKIKQKQKWYMKVYFTPQSKFIIIFKCITLILIYMYFLQIPITIAFENHRQQEQSQHFFMMVNIPAIVIFLLSVIIKFKTSFYRQGILISNQKQILHNYFVYFFLFDFLSITSIIIYEFSQILRDKTDPLPYRYIVLLFYLKIPQLMQIQSGIISSFDLNRRIKAFFKLVLLMLKIFMLCNVAACCFFYISDTLCPMNDPRCQNKNCCWIYQAKAMNRPLSQLDWNIQYVFSLYWASTTMLSIGYGDITPVNLPQAVYTVIAQFTSCLLYAFSINQIWSIIQQKNAKKSKIHSRMNIINVYMRDKSVSDDLKSRINAYLSHFYHTKNLRQKQLQGQIITQLTPSLKKQLYYQSYGFIFKTHSLFKIFSEQVLEKASQYIRQVGFYEQQIVYQPYLQQQLSLYYIHKGQLLSYIDLGNSRTKNIRLQLYQKGTIAGIYQFIRQLNYCSSLMAIKYSLLYVLDYNNWINTLWEYDQDRQQFYMLMHKSQYQGRIKKLKLQCKLCGSTMHQSDMCLQQQIQAKTERFLDKYLRKSQRMTYIRKNFKPINTDNIKSHNLVFDTTEFRTKAKRKNSLAIPTKKQKNQSVKKTFLHNKNTHNQKMNKIIQKQKMRSSVWSSQQSSQGQMINQIDFGVQGVQNYQVYWPQMNATATDWGKQRRRATFNRLLMKQ